MTLHDSGTALAAMLALGILFGFLAGYWLGRRAEQAYWVEAAENDPILGRMPVWTDKGTYYAVTEGEYNALCDVKMRRERGWHYQVSKFSND